MIEKKKVNFILNKLNTLYPDPQPPLQYQSIYELLIAVLLSAQCTDKVVNKVTPELFKTANTPHKMMKVNLATIKRIIKPCGLYPKKSVAIKELSKILVEHHQGKVPNNIELLETLPGVGHKTASVVMIQGFHSPAFPVDTHIHRLAARWGISNGKSIKQTEKDLKLTFDKKYWIKLHLQMIYYGREYCPARNHDLSRCMICQYLSVGTS